MHSPQQVLAPLHRLMTFAQYVKVRRMVESSAKEPAQTFWNMTMNLLANAAAIEWSMVFGSWDEDTHWKKVVPKSRQADERAHLLSHLGMAERDWKMYRPGAQSRYFVCGRSALAWYAAPSASHTLLDQVRSPRPSHRRSEHIDPCRGAAMRASGSGTGNRLLSSLAHLIHASTASRVDVVISNWTRRCVFCCRTMDREAIRSP